MGPLWAGLGCLCGAADVGQSCLKVFCASGAVGWGSVRITRRHKKYGRSGYEY